MPFLDNTGLAHFWNQIVARLNTKVEIEDFEDLETSVLERIDNIDLSAYETTTNAQSKLEEAKSYTDTKVSGLASTTVVDNKVSTHNTSTSAHSDIRDLISGLTTRLNTLANSDDTTLDQMSEVVAYIKNNKSLIEGITTSKVNVDDVIDNLTTNVTNKPLSAAQGVALKALIDELDAEKLDTESLPDAINSALAQAKASGEFDGADGYSPVRGTDYWTDADKAEIKSYVDEAILGGAW